MQSGHKPRLVSHLYKAISLELDIHKTHCYEELEKEQRQHQHRWTHHLDLVSISASLVALEVELVQCYIGRMW